MLTSALIERRGCARGIESPVRPLKNILESSGIPTRESAESVRTPFGQAADGMGATGGGKIGAREILQPAGQNAE